MIFLSTGAQILMFDPADIATPTVVMDAASGMTLYLFQPPNQFSLDGSKLYFVETDGTTTTVGYTTCSVRTDLFTTALTPGFATCGTAFKTSDDLTFFLGFDDGSTGIRKFDIAGTVLHTNTGGAHRLLHGSWLESDHIAHFVAWKSGPDGSEFPASGIYSNKVDLNGSSNQSTVNRQNTSSYSAFTVWPTAMMPTQSTHAIMPYAGIITGHSEYEFGKVEYGLDGSFIQKSVSVFADPSLTGYVARLSPDASKVYAIGITSELSSIWYSPSPFKYFAKLGDIDPVDVIYAAQLAVGDARVCGFLAEINDAGLAHYPGKDLAALWGPPLV